jgi:topoisomerase-4 subunit A
VFEKDFSDIAIKGRQSIGNILTKNDIHKITLKQKGGSTLGGREVWFDSDVLRLNYDNRGEYLGEFQSDDLILVVSGKGEFRTCNFDLSNHFEKDILVIEKFNPDKVWSVALYDADQQFYYLKRFQFEISQKPLNFLGENPESRLMLMSDVDYPRFEVVFGGNDAYRESLVVDAENFIGVKSYKAKGKRLTTFEVDTINELEPEPERFATVKEKSEENEKEENGESSEEIDINEVDETLNNSETTETPEVLELIELPKEKEAIKTEQNDFSQQKNENENSPEGNDTIEMNATDSKVDVSIADEFIEKVETPVESKTPKTKKGKSNPAKTEKKKSVNIEQNNSVSPDDTVDKGKILDENTRQLTLF